MDFTKIFEFGFVGEGTLSLYTLKFRNGGMQTKLIKGRLASKKTEFYSHHYVRVQTDFDYKRSLEFGAYIPS